MSPARSIPRRGLRLVCLAGLVAALVPPPARAVEIVAHRGAYLLHPENTLAAFRGCAGLADRIEFDVRTSADGQLVVIHDPAVNRTTTGWGSVTNVAQLTLAELQALDAGARFAPEFTGERIPTLAEALGALPPGIPPLVHVKAGDLAAVAATLHVGNAPANTLVACDGLAAAAEFARLDPDHAVCLTGSGPLDSIMLGSFRNHGVSALLWAKNDLTPEAVRQIQAAGLRVYVSLSTPEAESFRNLGLDGILIDNPRKTWAWAQLPPPLARGLIAYWKLDDGLLDPGTTEAADVFSQSPGRLAGFDRRPAWLSGEEARLGGALRLDGLDDHVRLPTNAVLDIGTNAVSISLWVNLAVRPSGLPKSFGGIYDDLVQNAYVVYLDREQRELRFRVTDAAGAAARAGIPETLLQTGAWHHVVGVYDGAAGPAVGQVLIYLDGRLVNVRTGADAAPGCGLNRAVMPGQAAVIGRNGAEDDYYFAGAVDDIAIWRRPLFPAEVRRIHAAGRSGVSLDHLTLGL